MAVTLASFRLRYGEFSATADAEVQAAIDDAEANTSDLMTGDTRDRYVGVYAAHLLTLGPFARNSRLDDTGKGPYSQELESLRSDWACAWSRWG